MPDSAAFPRIAPKPHLQLKEDLPGQIYTIDGFLSDVEQVNVLKWAQAVDLKAPTKPGKGEAERTARRGTTDSPEIAQAILDALSPHLSHLDPSYHPSVPLLSPNIRVYHYPPKTFFRGHYDSPQMDMRSKRLSCWTVLVYLSNGVRGGGTTFWLDDPDRDGAGAKGAKGKAKGGDAGKGKAGKAGKGVGKEGSKGKGAGVEVSLPRSLTFEPKAGRVLLHWHGVARGGCMLHEGDEVVSGDKWVLRTDVLA